MDTTVEATLLLLHHAGELDRMILEYYRFPGQRDRESRLAIYRQLLKLDLPPKVTEAIRAVYFELTSIPIGEFEPWPRVRSELNFHRAKGEKDDKGIAQRRKEAQRRDRQRAQLLIDLIHLVIHPTAPPP